ncbi:DUF2608 domain-containing protein [Leptolyngbya sp. 15MV]|nr:DUF2608 domain-containing protein [Leptolyngbya sp. 15MV]
MRIAVTLFALLLGMAACTTPMPASRAEATPPVRGEPVPIEPIGEMARAVDRALEMAQRHGPERVLVIFDLDSTLLRDPRRSPDLDPLEAADPVRFRQVERTVMYLKSLAPTEPGLAGQLARLRTAGIPAYLMTARGADMRDMTLREMDANGIVLPPAPECGPPLCIGRGAIRAEAVHAAAEQVLGRAELDRVGFGRGRLITVWDGIVMAAGLDKGVLMRTLGASLGGEIGGYVFIDDARKNVDNVARVSSAMHEEVAVFHYTSPERGGAVRSQAEADADWAETEAAICRTFAPRWCR